MYLCTENIRVACFGFPESQVGIHSATKSRASECVLVSKYSYSYYYYSSSSGFYNPLAGFSLLIIKVSRSHTMTQQSR
jgi:hypothetical protein